MGYKKMKSQDIYNIFRRWHSGQKIKEIARTEGLDRKTVRKYLNKLANLGLNKDIVMPDKISFFKAIEGIFPEIHRTKERSDELTKYLEDIKALIKNPKEGVKPKTAFEIIKERKGVRCSYETFKRFSRMQGLTVIEKNTTIRIELPPGQEIQLDYGKVGFFEENGNRRVVYAFACVLSHSRLPFIQFVYTQQSESFVESNIAMIEFYEGATERINLDNLKSGVIKADLWDPKLNKSYSEMAEHYGVFLDPARPASPKDKGKIERMIPTARELFLKLKNLYPGESLTEINRRALNWCRNEYGMKKHGTTGLKPWEVYEEIEKPILKKLPEERFEIPVWKQAKVHPDQFVQFEKKRYSLPAKYRGELVWIRKSGNRIRIFQEHRMIREYLIPKGHRAYEKNDFPEIIREMMDGGFPKYLLNSAEKYGQEVYSLIKNILTPHAYLNSRKAQGMLDVVNKYYEKNYFHTVLEKALRNRIYHPSCFRNMLEDEEKKSVSSEPVPLSEKGRLMTRESEYYFH